ncbi:hypothetical protein [Erythrobacter sp. F6033]|uniref:hypothetical protein n=1 Tax=Erythrobacter sp. F6033 TaxID=2926401 RepID=UPI001FF3B0B7|nr:hypothetical protein [Erythrobacter sp. F6033]MCK0128090.1 hypothetical protein [Erythrobacter sp. F6033]
MNEKTPHWSEVDHEALEDTHRLAIADCVMSWAKCESNLRALLTALEGRSLVQGAKDYDRLNPNDVWKKIKKLMRRDGASDHVLEAIQKHRDLCRSHYETRRVIVHAGCVGLWKRDRSFLAFSAFEQFDSNQMTLYWVPLSDLKNSADYAQSAQKLALNLLQKLGH